MKKIGLIVYDISLTGGAERVAINLANEFAKRETAFIISVFRKKELPKVIDCNVICHTISDKHDKITIKFNKYKRELRKILLEEKIDILLSITAGVATLATQAASGTPTKVVYCEHSNLENRTYGWKHVFRQFYGAKKSDVVVTLTDRDRNNFIKMFRIKEDKVVTIPNWYTYRQSSNTYDATSKKIISVGRLEKVKGYDYIIKTAEIILKNNPDWKWDIFGEGSLHSTLQEQIIERGIKRLTLMGNVNDIEERYRQYAFVVMTSLFEGLPLSLLEAQSSHLPIVSFDCPTGPSEIIINNVNGYIVPQFDVTALVEKIQLLIDSEEKRREFSNHSEEKLWYFDKERVVRLWNELFLRLINSGACDE